MIQKRSWPNVFCAVLWLAIVWVGAINLDNSWVLWYNSRKEV